MDRQIEIQKIFLILKSFNYKIKITEELNASENRKNNIKIFVPLKNLSNFSRTF